MIKSILLLFAFPLMAFCQTDILTSFSVANVLDWDDLKRKDQSLIKKASEEYLLKLVENDVKGVWELGHSKFKKTTPFIYFSEMGLLIANMVTSMDSLEFVDGKKVVFQSLPKSNTVVFSGSMDKEDPTFLQFFTINGIKNQALVIYRLNGSPLSKVITMKFGLEDSVYKVLSFEINTCSIFDKDADYYFELSKKWASDEPSFSQYMALYLAYRLSNLGNGTNTRKFIEMGKELQALQMNKELAKEGREWIVNDSLFNIINIDFLETKSDVTLNVNYISKVELGEETTEAEVEILFQYFKKKHPDLVQELEVFSFTAYKEFPAIATKQYEYFRVIKDINETE